MAEVKIQEEWKKLLAKEFAKPYFNELSEFVKKEYQKHQCFPSGPNIFRCFDLCPPQDVKVVLLGQDPYIRPGQAHGLCFSVQDGVQFPPSLQNMFKEIQSDLGTSMPDSGNLTRWAEQGVLLLNATLTVREGQSGSHQGRGWETFTDAVIATIGDQLEGVVFLLWGSYAQKKARLIDARKHHLLKAPHPSPLSAYRGFFGCKHFSQTNELLEEKGVAPIEW